MTTWVLRWCDFARHRFGQPPPTLRQARFPFREEAAAEMAGLRADSGPGFVAGIAAVGRKPATGQADFGFPLGGERRLTAKPNKKADANTAPASLGIEHVQ